MTPYVIMVFPFDELKINNLHQNFNGTRLDFMV
jgi:hypothetical protein